MSISKEKKALIHVAKAQLHIADADYRAVLMRAAGVASSSNLDDVGFAAVMTEFERLGFRGGRPRTQAAGMATDAQIGRIKSLWKGYTGEDDELRLGRWLEKTFHVSHVRFLDAGSAGKAVAILTAMQEHPNAKRPVAAKRRSRKDEGA